MEHLTAEPGWEALAEAGCQLRQAANQKIGSPKAMQVEK